jgi:hypothetical protein
MKTTKVLHRLCLGVSLALPLPLVASCGAMKTPERTAGSGGKGGKTSTASGKSSGGAPKPKTAQQLLLEKMPADLQAKTLGLEKMPAVALNVAEVSNWPGLPNLGNTCFFNSALKLLARHKDFVGVLNPNPLDNAATAKARSKLKAVMNMIRLGSASPLKGSTPAEDNKLLDTVGTYVIQDLIDAAKGHPSFAGFVIGGPQQDSSEAIVKLFESLRIEALPEFALTVAEELRTLQLLPVRAFGPPTYEVQQYSIDAAGNPILGPITQFPWKLQKDADTVTTSQELFDHFSFPEQRRTASSFSIYRYVVTRIPDNAIVQVIRYYQDGTFHKNVIAYTDPVHVPVYTIAADGASATSVAQDINRIAIIVHSGTGSIRCGHYFAYIKGENEKWYNNNDRTVTPIELGDIKEQKTGDQLSAKFYTLLYEKVP